MKIATLFLSLVIVVWGYGQSLLWNNGQFIDEWNLTPKRSYFADFGAMGIQIAENWENTNVPRAWADNFTLCAGGAPSHIVFWTCQAFTEYVSHMQACNIRIWNGIPGSGGSVIVGDLTTNRLISSEYSGVVRQFATGPIFRHVADMSWVGVLSPGTYWMELTARSFQNDQAIFNVPVTRAGVGQANAWERMPNGAWQPTSTHLVNSVRVDLMFRLYGSRPYPGDTNRNCCVDDTDLALILSNFGRSGWNQGMENILHADLNSDGIIDDIDLAIVLGDFGRGCR